MCDIYTQEGYVPVANKKKPELQKPDAMPRALFEKIKRDYEEADTLNKKAIIDLLDRLTRQESVADAHPAESEFERMVGLTDSGEE